MASHFVSPFTPTYLGICALLIVRLVGPALAQETKDDELDKAVAALRHVKPEELHEKSKQAAALELTRNWNVIIDAGKRGAERLKKELRAIDDADEEDDFFKLGACALLWEIGRQDEAETIARVWTSTRLHVQYNYVFFTAFEAAKTQDPKVLPMLKAVLCDGEGSISIREHALHIACPLTHIILWETFGPKGLPALHAVLKTSKDSVALDSAVILLSRAHYIDALPTLRRLAKGGSGAARMSAIASIGEFGHPLDYDFLAGGLESPDADLQAAHLQALVLYEDLRAVPRLARLLEARESAVRGAAIYALGQLLNTEGLEALRNFAEKSKVATTTEKEACRRLVEKTLTQLEMNWDTFAAKNAQERDRLLATLDPVEDRYTLKPGDRRLSRDEFKRAVKYWKQEHRITGGEYEWVEERHVAAVTTPDDLDLLIDLRAAVYYRLSDECLYEVATINNLLSRIGRARYREIVGLCPKVEPRSPGAIRP